MSGFNKLVAGLLTLFWLGGAGCTYQRSIVLAPVGLPEEVYVNPPPGIGDHFRHVGVFRFSEPGHAPRMGLLAARILSAELLKSRIYSRVTLDGAASDGGSDRLADIARQRGYDAIITGELLDFFEGSAGTSARVEILVSLFAMIDGQPRILWYARAVENVAPLPSKHFVSVDSPGVAPPPTGRLLRRNAQKVCNMLRPALGPDDGETDAGSPDAQAPVALSPEVQAPVALSPEVQAPVALSPDDVP